MNKINCEVTKCSHNCEYTCYANRVNIGGQGAKKIDDTCCGSFLDKSHYSTLTNNTNSDSNKACDCLVCEAETCIYNSNKLCIADNIKVNGSNANVYMETACATFKQK